MQQLSPDGKWQWNETSQQWEPIVPLDVGEVSPDGAYRWDDIAWQATGTPDVGAPPPQPSGKRRTGKGKLIGAGVAGVLVLGGLAAIGGSGGEGGEPTASATTESAPAAESPESVESPSEPSEPAQPTLSHRKELQNSIRSAVEPQGDRPKAKVAWSKGDKTLYVTFSVSDNFSNNLIKKGAAMDVADILRTTQGTFYGDRAKKVEVAGTFPMQNNLGEDLGERVVMRAVFAGSDVERMQFDNLTSEQVMENAQSLYWHQAFSD